MVLEGDDGGGARVGTVEEQSSDSAQNLWVEPTGSAVIGCGWKEKRGQGQFQGVQSEAVEG